MGREDVTKKNPLGFVPVSPIPENPEEVKKFVDSEEGQKALEESMAASEDDLPTYRKMTTKDLKILFPNGVPDGYDAT